MPLSQGQKIGIGIGAALGIAALIGISSAEASVGGASLSGTVTDGQGNPLSDVLVVVQGNSVYTDVAGRYIINGLMPGEYPVTFTKSGYQTITV